MIDNLAKQKLSEAKIQVQLFAMDYDGTLVDGKKYQRDDAIGLIELILEKGKTPAFITARAATAVKTFVPPLQEFYLKYPDAMATYIGGGNGTVLYKVDAKGVKQIYSHGLSLSEVKNLVSVWEAYSKNNLSARSLSEKGLATFKKFYEDDWAGLIPPEVLDIGRPYNGQVFTEQAKVTFVLPKDIILHSKIVSDMQKLVGDNFSAAAGDKDFCHITKRLHEDGKVVAVKTILEILGLAENQVATFGDMPHGNDQGLLSFPYSFTNSPESAKIKDDLIKPPFVLWDDSLLPVERIYQAVKFLL